ncbi:uncharacterized protein LOC129574708 [Sitodiplosis mosellana]|uniref:uncharacterized protein LOC129574708 n=1 Tax=Sitodiplosis mosellana TaxID=263140 RepID=UPI002443A745|nr:uncharacterized protein LOC129574708 [Sitodiplosis mosellana]
MAAGGPKIVGNYPIEQIWMDESKGLRKALISFKFQSTFKANDFSKCCVAITEVNGLKEHHASEYLRAEHRNLDYWITLSNAVTPIDCYVEVFLKRMLIGETSQCAIKTKSGDYITFVIRLIRIEFGGYLYGKTLPDIVALAQHYRENGVKMFKDYPLFAHDYFNKAAKVLISCKPFETLAERESGMTEVDPVKLRELLETILSNISLCLIKQQRYDEAAHVMEFADRPENVPDKQIYRRAIALYHLGKLDDARKTIERINYKDKKECLLLHNNIAEKLKESDQNYRKMIKNMFA